MRSTFREENWKELLKKALGLVSAGMKLNILFLLSWQLFLSLGEDEKGHMKVIQWVKVCHSF